jgi:hypothetical protein
MRPSTILLRCGRPKDALASGEMDVTSHRGLEDQATTSRRVPRQSSRVQMWRTILK